MPCRCWTTCHGHEDKCILLCPQVHQVYVLGLQGIMGVFMREPLLDWHREARVLNAKRSAAGSAKDPVLAADTVDPQDMHINLKVRAGGRRTSTKGWRGGGGVADADAQADTIVAVCCSPPRVYLMLTQLALHTHLSLYSLSTA